MARMIDNIRANGLLVGKEFRALAVRAGKDEDGAVQEAISDILNAVPVVIDNVAPHYFNLANRKLDQMPPLIPPFPRVWLEAKLPGSRNSHFGCLYQPLSTKTGRGAFLELYLEAGAKRFAWGPTLGAIIPMDDMGFFDGAMSTRLARDASRSLDFDVGYSATDYPLVISVFDLPGKADRADDPRLGGFFEAAVDLFRMALFAVGMMNCSNIETVVVTPPAKLSKKRRKRHGAPLVKYRVIRVREKGQRRSSKPKKGDGGDPVAMHIVRGHFKTFTPEAPLLGKHVGTYWWGAQVRGNPERGVSEHDYEVDP